MFGWLTFIFSGQIQIESFWIGFWVWVKFARTTLKDVEFPFSHTPINNTYTKNQLMSVIPKDPNKERKNNGFACT